MRKKYYTYVDRYDYFDYDNKYHKSGYEYLGSTTLEALEKYKKLKSHDYDYGDSYQKTHSLEMMWEFEKPTNNHNLFTPEEDRIIKIPVVDISGKINKIIISTPKKVQKELSGEFFWNYNKTTKRIEEKELDFIF